MIATVSERRKVGVSKVALRRSLCRESYFDFLQTFWDQIIAEKPVWNWHIRFLCSEVQKVCERIFKREQKKYDLIINIPPGSTKSTICSVMLLPWMWTRMPECRFLGGSWEGGLSLEFGNKARNLIKSELYQETFPEIKISIDQDTKGFFSNTFKGERVATSSGASIVGRHFHIHVIDDPINPAGARSELDLRTVHQWMTEAVAQRCVDLKITPLVLVMQRLSPEDPSGMRLSRVGGTPVRHICLPAEVSDNVKPPVLKSKYKKGLLDPVRLSQDLLEEKKIFGQYFYSGQYEQLPVPLTGGLFEVGRLVGPKLAPAAERFKYVIRWWDKGGTQGSGAYTAGVLMGLLKNEKEYPRYWILDVVRKQLGTHEREQLIRRTSEADRERWGPIYRIGQEQEPGSGGKDSALATVWNLDGFVVITERATGKKEDRAEPFATQVNGGNVAFVDGPWNKAYIDELQFFGEQSKFKDQVDSSSGGFNWLSRRRLKAGALRF
jgi:predicted phage terminase large subunit-like protein